ncbi:MAG TPA: phosphoribosylamine--glycine ligase [Opitutaceae bacterium]|nr:phosphoribosylamine--glycine ligase [Opitutaceae bacterium]
MFNVPVTAAHPKRILVVGSGGREHTLVKTALVSPGVERVIAAPGNGGIAEQVTCYSIPVENIKGLLELAQRERIDFVIVGPEVPLSLGLVDALSAKGIAAYGPKADGARLEASKVFTKQILLKNKIPTAPAAFFEDLGPALTYLRSRPVPIVIKADGLAAGKGVVVATASEEAEAAVKSMLVNGAFGASGRQILIEDCLHGEETSLHVIVSGLDYVILPTAQDHKRIGDGDTGPNTGGMGAYSPAEVVTPALLATIEKEIVRPSVQAIAAEGIDFRGTLFIGLMLTAQGPQVLEFNTRFGDPETQVILPRLKTDVIALLWAAAHNQLFSVSLEVKTEYALCVVLAAKGYPDSYPKGDVIKVPANADILPGSFVIHAGTAKNAHGQIVSNGGRVLGAVALSSSLKGAADQAYSLAKKIEWPHKYFRKDIGARQLNRK